jgi:hypothetical protein
MKNFDGKELKKARNNRDRINTLSRSELFSECKKLNIKVSREKNDVLKNKLKEYYYNNLEDYEKKLLKKEKPLTDEEIDNYVNENLNKIYKESFKQEETKKIDSDLRLIYAMRGKK